MDRFLLEYDDERSGTFEPLRFVPQGQDCSPGTGQLESARNWKATTAARRNQRSRKYFPLEKLALSPQCGFASTMEGNLLTEDEQWAKLRLVAETARQVWS